MNMHQRIGLAFFLSAILIAVIVCAINRERLSEGKKQSPPPFFYPPCRIGDKRGCDYDMKEGLLTCSGTVKNNLEYDVCDVVIVFETSRSNYVLSSTPIFVGDIGGGRTEEFYYKRESTMYVPVMQKGLYVSQWHPCGVSFEEIIACTLHARVL